jgi:hypothetical protein
MKYKIKIRICQNISKIQSEIKQSKNRVKNYTFNTHIHDLSQNRIKYMPFCIHNKIILSVICESIFDASIINVSWQQKLIRTLL